MNFRVLSALPCASLLFLSGCAPTVHTIRELDLDNAAHCIKLSEESCVSTFAGPLGANTGYQNCKDELMSKGEAKSASHIVWTSWASNAVTTVTAQTFNCRKVAGVGASLRMENGQILFAEVIPEGPAGRAGISKGAILQSVDSLPVSGLTLDQVTWNLRGIPETPVRLRFVGDTRQYDLNRILLPAQPSAVAELRRSAQRQSQTASGTQGAFTSFVQQNQPDPNWAQKHQANVDRDNARVQGTIAASHDVETTSRAMSQDKDRMDHAPTQQAYDDALRSHNENQRLNNLAKNQLNGNSNPFSQGN